MHALCRFGWHDWGYPYNIRGGSKSNVMLCAIIEELFTPKKCDKKCKRCGKVKEFTY